MAWPILALLGKFLLGQGAKGAVATAAKGAVTGAVKGAAGAIGTQIGTKAIAGAGVKAAGKSMLSKAIGQVMEHPIKSALSMTPLSPMTTSATTLPTDTAQQIKGKEQAQMFQNLESTSSKLKQSEKQPSMGSNPADTYVPPIASAGDSSVAAPEFAKGMDYTAPEPQKQFDQKALSLTGGESFDPRIIALLGQIQKKQANPVGFPQGYF